MLQHGLSSNISAIHSMAQNWSSNCTAGNHFLNNSANKRNAPEVDTSILTPVYFDHVILYFQKCSHGKKIKFSASSTSSISVKRKLPPLARCLRCASIFKAYVRCLNIFKLPEMVPNSFPDSQVHSHTQCEVVGGFVYQVFLTRAMHGGWRVCLSSISYSISSSLLHQHQPPFNV